jgi:hypothetical protein
MLLEFIAFKNHSEHKNMLFIISSCAKFFNKKIILVNRINDDLVGMTNQQITIYDNLDMDEMLWAFLIEFFDKFFENFCAILDG